jgi:hypothetical protein
MRALIVLGILAACGDSSTSSVDAALVDASSADGAPSVPVDAPETALDAGTDAISNGTPMVTGVVPANSATGVEPAVAIEATFDIDMAAGSIDATTFVVRRGGNAVPGTVTYDVATRTATFRPTTKLVLRGLYTATLVRDITSGAGQHLAADHVWSFTVRDGVWGAAETVATGTVGCPAIAADAAGIVTAAWNVDNGAGTDLIGSRHVPGALWDDGMALEHDNGSASCPSVGVDAVGRVTVVWERMGSGPDETIATRFDGTWSSSPMTLSNSGGDDIDSPLVSVSANGDAMAIWTKSGPMHHETWVRRFTPGTGWEAAVMLDVDTSGVEWYQPRIAADASGNFIALWLRMESERSLMTARFTPSAGWSAPQRLSITHDNGQRLAMSPAGDAIATWVIESDRPHIWAARFTVAGGWSAPERVDTQEYAAFSSASTTVNGVTTVVWVQYTGVGPAPISLWARRHVIGAGWGPPMQVSDGAGSVWLHDMASDADGNAFVVYTQADGPRDNIWARRMVDGVWTAPLLLEESDIRASQPRVAVDASGAATVVWTQGSIQSRTFR